MASSRPELIRTHTTQEEYRVMLDGQLIGWIGKCGPGLWSVRGMGEQLSPCCARTRSRAVAVLIDAAKKECRCMVEDPRDGYGERVVTHSLDCPHHPEHEPE
jgi:hypothetical protein